MSISTNTVDGHYNQFNIEMIALHKLDIWVNANVRTEEITADIGPQPRLYRLATSHSRTGGRWTVQNAGWTTSVFGSEATRMGDDSCQSGRKP